MKTKVVFLSDSLLISRGLTDMLADSVGFLLISIVQTVDQACSELIRHNASLLIVSPHLLTVTQSRDLQSTFGQVAVVALLYHYVEQSSLRAYNGVIEVNDSIRRMESVLQSAVTVLSEKEDGEGAVNGDLSEREKEVLVAIAKGLQNKEIAENLNISVYTAITHRRNIMLKTSIKSVAGLTVYALINNLIGEEDVI